MKVQYVEPQHIHTVWPIVEPMLDKALQYSGNEYNVHQLKVFIVQGIHHLLVVVDKNGIKGAITVEFMNYPNERVAFVTAIGGKMISTKEGWSQFENWLKLNGATLVRGIARESVARLWRKAFQFEPRCIMVEKRL